MTGNDADKLTEFVKADAFARAANYMTMLNMNINSNSNINTYQINNRYTTSGGYHAAAVPYGGQIWLYQDFLTQLHNVQEQAQMLVHENAHLDGIILEVPIFRAFPHVDHSTIRRRNDAALFLGNVPFRVSEEKGNEKAQQDTKDREPPPSHKNQHHRDQKGGEEEGEPFPGDPPLMDFFHFFFSWSHPIIERNFFPTISTGCSASRDRSILNIGRPT